MPDALRGSGVDECVVKPCDSSPCLNGATCSNIGDNYVCTCVDGFTGTSCEWEITPCLLAGQTCLNGGECLTVTEGHQCVCPFDSKSSRAFVGLTCNECESYYCRSLFDLANTSFCILAKSFDNAQFSRYGFLTFSNSQLR